MIPYLALFQLYYTKLTVLIVYKDKKEKKGMIR